MAGSEGNTKINMPESTAILMGSVFVINVLLMVAVVQLARNIDDILVVVGCVAVIAACLTVLWLAHVAAVTDAVDETADKIRRDTTWYL